MIDTLRDTALPRVDGLFLGGGFPERHMQALEANRGLRVEFRAAIEAGLPVCAECGGLMYLSRQISWDGASAEMVGVLPVDVVMQKRPRGRGYVRLKETRNAPWPHADDTSVERQETTELCAHEFHYSQVCNVKVELSFAYDVSRGHGIDGKHDGNVYRNTLASYSHLRDTAQNRWTRRFIAHVNHCRQTHGAH